MTDFRNRLQFDRLVYSLWLIFAAISACAAIFCVIFGRWSWALGWFVGALALAAHARLERFDGHTHRNGGVEAP